MKDPYEVLGVSRTASPEEIKRAYRRKARECHPDSDPDNPWAETAFKELNAAHDILSDLERRASFDARATGPRRRRNFDPFFRQREKREKSGIRIKGANVEYTLTINFLEAACGTTRHVGMTTGRHLDVGVPPGTKDDQILRLKGQGMPGIGGAEAGDALVEITVEPHPAFTLKGYDVHSDLPVTVAEAVTGAKVEAKTIDGLVAVTVPAGSNTDTILRLKGKGVRPSPNAARGDHYVTLKVVLPAKTDDKFKRFVENWAPKNPYTVRRKTKKTETTDR